MESQSACVTRAINLPELEKLAASTSTSASADPVEPELSVRTPLEASDANAPLDRPETRMLLVKERRRRPNVLLLSRAPEESFAPKANVCVNEDSKEKPTECVGMWTSVLLAKTLRVEQMLSARTFQAALTVNALLVSMGIRL